ESGGIEISGRRERLGVVARLGLLVLVVLFLRLIRRPSGTLLGGFRRLLGYFLARPTRRRGRRTADTAANRAARIGRGTLGSVAGGSHRIAGGSPHGAGRAGLTGLRCVRSRFAGDRPRQQNQGNDGRPLLPKTLHSKATPAVPMPGEPPIVPRESAQRHFWPRIAPLFWDCCNWSGIGTSALRSRSRVSSARFCAGSVLRSAGAGPEV